MRTIEEVQAYWDRRPCNIRHSSEPVGSIHYFAQVAHRKYFVEPHILAFADFGRWNSKVVLELGCGIGTDTINFAWHGANVWALDISRVSLELVRERAWLYGVNNRVTTMRRDIEEMDAFCLPDLIYSFGVIHHTPHPAKAIQRIAECAGPNTVIKIMLYHRYSWKALCLFLRYRNLHNSEAQQGCPVTHVYSKRQARRLLEENGIRVKSMFVDHIFPYRIPDYVNYRFVKVWYFRWMPARLFRWLERHWGWHLCIEAEKVC